MRDQNFPEDIGCCPEHTTYNLQNGLLDFPAKTEYISIKELKTLSNKGTNGRDTRYNTVPGVHCSQY